LIDTNQTRIDDWNSDHLPLYEPGLAEIVSRQRGVNLFFTTNVAENIRKADVVFIAVNTPNKEFGSKVRPQV
jgi:UDPglucose 6-dehydrogenase